MKGEDMRQLDLKNPGDGCNSVPVNAVTCGIIDVARRLPEEIKAAHVNRPS